MPKPKTKVEILDEKAAVQAELDSALSRIQAFQDAQKAGVITKLRQAFAASWLATMVGLVAGGGISGGVWWLIHKDLADASKHEWYWVLSKPQFYLVLMGLYFSATTVSKWMTEALENNKGKGIAWTVFAEGMLTFSNDIVPSYIALGLLVFINAAASASCIALQERKI